MFDLPGLETGLSLQTEEQHTLTEDQQPSHFKPLPLAMTGLGVQAADLTCMLEVWVSWVVGLPRLWQGAGGGNGSVPDVAVGQATLSLLLYC